MIADCLCLLHCSNIIHVRLQDRQCKQEAPLPLPPTEEPFGLSKDAAAAESTAAMAVAAGEVAAATAQAQAAVPGSDEHKTAEVRAVSAAMQSACKEWHLKNLMLHMKQTLEFACMIDACKANEKMQAHMHKA